MPSDKYADWHSKMQAAQLIGTSERTLERMIQRGEIQTAQRRIPGRRPLTVCNPRDVERIRETTAQPVEWVEPRHTAPVSGETAGLAVSAPVALPPVVDLLRSLLDHVQPRQWPLFLTLEQASTYTGLPQGTLTRYLSDGILTGVWAKGWRIRRTDLDAL